MKKQSVYFTAGPSEIYPTVPGHIKTAIDEQIYSMSHRGEAFQTLFVETINKLMAFLNIPTDHKIYFLASANECWERIIQNTVEKHSFHFVNGAFGKRFYEISSELKKEPKKFEVEFGSSFDFKNVTIPSESEIVCLTQNESSTGVALDIGAVQQLKIRFPDKLFAMDVVSSIPYVDIDYSLIDIVYFSVQKGFGLPAGMAVMIVSPAAFEKSLYLQKKGLNVGSYHSFSTLEKFADKSQTPETPNVLNIYLLNRVLTDMQHKTIQTIRKEIDVKAKSMYVFFESRREYELFVKSKIDRSPSVVVVKPPEVEACLQKLKKNGIIVGRGYGPYKKTHLRISNFPAHTPEQVEKLLKILDN